MVKFETIKSDEAKFGNNNFIEVARKKAISDDGENEFISVSRGFVDMNGNRRYRKSIAVPLDPSVVNFVADKVKEMGEGAEAPKPEKKEKKTKKKKEKEEISEENSEKMEQEADL